VLCPGLQVPEIQYFGASALHTKISRYWADIPADQYESLKSQLFSQIACFSSGSKMVLTRLCVALASLALNTMPEAWPGAVAQMVSVFQEEGGGVDGRARCLALLELLTVLPEEFHTSRLPQYRKGQVGDQRTAGSLEASIRGVLLFFLPLLIHILHFIHFTMFVLAWNCTQLLNKYCILWKIYDFETFLTK